MTFNSDKVLGACRVHFSGDVRRNDAQGEGAWVVAGGVLHAAVAELLPYADGVPRDV